MYTYNSVIEFKFIYLQFYRSKQNEYDESNSSEYNVNIPITNETVQFTRSKRTELSTIRNIILSRTNFFPFLSFFLLFFRPRVILINSRGRDSQRGEFIKTLRVFIEDNRGIRNCVYGLVIPGPLSVL